MDQLDILKSKWQSQQRDFPQYSREQLTGLIAKKSSSIVKWIFYIGIAEFVLLAVVTIFYTGNSKQQDELVAAIGEPFYYGSYVLSYVVIIYFLYRFYMNYKNISADQPARNLMKNILKTRRTMKQYIWFNLIYVAVFTIIASVFILYNGPQSAQILESQKFQEHQLLFTTAYIGAVLVFLIIFCGLIYGFYSLIYGILLRRLKRNYQELKKMEI